MRPKSILQFERLFLASLVLAIASDAFALGAIAATLKANTGTASLGMNTLIAIQAVIYAAALALWYFAAHRRSVVAKWLISAWFVLSTCTMALALFQGGFTLGVVAVLGVAAYLLRAWSVSYLFKPDADDWFAAKG